MKKFTFLLAALLCSVSLLAETVELNLASGTYDSGAGTITWTAVDGNITVTQFKVSGSTAVNKDYISAPRVYVGHVLSFECTTFYKINALDFVCAANGKNYYDGGTITIGTEIQGGNVTENDAFSYTNTGGNLSVTVNTEDGEGKIYTQGTTQLRPTSIVITYTKLDETQPTISCGDVAFGDVVDILSTSAPTQVLNVVGLNLTEAISYTLDNNTSFTVDGSLTAEGGTLTITFVGTTAGNHEATLTLTSGETSKPVTLSANLLIITGEGTKENPFTVDDVKALNSSLGTEEEYWVIGYICGSANNGGTVATTVAASNIALGSTKDATSGIVPVQLISNDVRTALDLTNEDHAGYVGRQVKVYGTLETYFSVPGVKNTSDYELLPDATTAVTEVAAPAQVVKMVENGQLVIVRDGVKYNAQGVKLN